MESKIISKKKIKKNTGKVLFIQRFMAFLLDMLFISMISSLISMPFVNTNVNDKLNERIVEVNEKMTNEDMSIETYLSEYSDIAYKNAKNNGMVSIITIFLSVLYFVVYQLYFNGQTIGKKLMKIKVVSDNGELMMNQMIFRSFLANFILVDLISFMFMIFGSKSIYFYCYGFFQIIQYIIVFISLIMIIYSKDGCALHDKLVHTKVIRAE